MRIVVVFLSIALLAVTAAGVSAAPPSFAGYTGLGLLPTADALAARQFNGGYMVADNDDQTLTNFFVNYGIAEDLEVGVNVTHFEDNGSDTQFNAKYAISLEEVAHAGVAVGIIDATSAVERGMYVVASKSIDNKCLRVYDGNIMNPRVHFGLGSGVVDGPLLGLSAGLGKSLILYTEYVNNNFDAGIRLSLTKGLRLYADWFDIGGVDDFGFGISYCQCY